MPDKICFRTDQYTRIASRLQKLSQELDGCAAQLGRISIDEEAGASLSIQLSGRLSSTGTALPSGQITDCLRAMRGTLRSVGGYASTLSSQVTQAAEIFEQGERDLISKIHDTGSAAPYADGTGSDGISLGDLGYDLPIFDFDPSNLWEAIQQALQNGKSIVEEGLTLITSPFVSFITAGEAIIGCAPVTNDGTSTTITTSILSDSSTSKNKLDLVKAKDKKEFSFSDPDPSSSAKKGDADSKESENPLKHRISLLTFSHSDTYTNSIFSETVSRESDKGSASTSYSIGNVEVSDTIDFGFYMSDDGQPMVGAGVKVGASVTAFEAGVSAEYEVIDNVTVKTSSELTVGKVGTDADLHIGLSEDGFSAISKVSAEAIVAEYSADIGVEVAGIETTASASVNVGFGAHAEASYHQGKLKLDVGASFGVGASVSIEVDMSGAINNIKTGAKKIGKLIGSIFS